MIDQKKDIAKHTRWYRKWHRYIGSWLLIFFTVIATTGLLLGWKKHSGGYILPDTQRGNSTLLSDWMPLDTLAKMAQSHLNQKFPELPNNIDRIDVRPDKGSLKVTFKNHYQEVQIDGASGKLLAINLRKSDIIEQIHDGSIFDSLFNFSGGFIKLFYTNAMGIGLLLLSLSGFWLWYNPKRIRKLK